MAIRKNVVILTGNETRHQYFKIMMAQDKRINVLASYCEDAGKSLSSTVRNNPLSSKIEKQHVEAREQLENDFFGTVISLVNDLSNSRFIAKGEINQDSIVREIERSGADVLVCYGSSLIKSSLLSSFKDKFLNVHLGLSPYYRGSGTNVWPLINLELDMVGATFMYIDEGIDTGKIIHQIRADFVLGDSPHSIGNRLIKKMTSVYCDIVARFDSLTDEVQPVSQGRLYLQKHFNEQACSRLYENFRSDMVRIYIENFGLSSLPYIVKNKALGST
jgi:phosphoribosylglycinamide formyltransferase-1